MDNTKDQEFQTPNHPWLKPISFLYKQVVTYRNWRYDQNPKKSVRFTVPVISVGNLSVGGTGKTPLVVFLIQLLCKDHKVGMVSRGYGRKTSKFMFAHKSQSIHDIGDEPFLIHRKLEDKVKIAVYGRRSVSIPLLLFDYPEIDVIVHDDGYQHREVSPSLNLLLTRYDRPFYKDKVLPEGRLREPPEQASRADALIFTKCPLELTEAQMNVFKKEASYFLAPNVPIYFSGLNYGPLLDLDGNPIDSSAVKGVMGISGIADPTVFANHLRSTYPLLSFRAFPDHYDFTMKDWKRLKDETDVNFPETTHVIMTEKDAVKIWNSDMTAIKSIFAPYKLAYQPIEVQFLGDQAAFHHLILSHLKSFQA